MKITVYIFALFISIVASSRQIMKYNTRYCISKPHYLSIMGPLHSSPKDIPRIDESYVIPKEVYKKIFKENIPYNQRS